MINPPTPPPPTGSSLAVVSLVGREFNLLHVGFTVFENGDDSCPAAPLDPDAYVRDVTKREIQRTVPGLHVFDLKCGAADSCAAASLPKAYEWTFSGGPDTFDVANIRGELQDALAKQPADRVLIFVRRRVQGEPNLSAHINGIGMFHRSMFGLLPRGYVHASLAAVLVDGKTLQPISTYGKVTQGPLDEAMWPGSECGKITPAQSASIQAALRLVLDRGVPELLSHFGMSAPSA